MKVVITGGHHTSALPVIDKLRENDSDIDVIWFGHRHSLLGDDAETLEYKDITSLEIPFYNLNAGKLYKTINIIRLLKVPWGFIQAFFLLLKTKPDIILSFGGYLAAPVVFAGWVLGIPSITHEQTVVTGYANRFISKFARKILISWEQSRKYFPGEKVVFSGLPIREEVFKKDGNDFKIDNLLPTIYITGGKTGSHLINEVVFKYLEELLYKYNIIHQCGEHLQTKDYEKLEEEYNKIRSSVAGRYILKKFVRNDEIGEVFSKTDLVIARSGAHTIKELMVLNKPALLIPISWSSHDEQHKNAEILKKIGLAEILTESKADKQFLIMVNDMMENLSNYKAKEIIQEKQDKKPEEIIVNQLYAVLKNEQI